MNPLSSPGAAPNPIRTEAYGRLCSWIYSRTAASLCPTADTQYPRAQKCCPTKFLRLPPFRRHFGMNTTWYLHSYLV